MHAHRDAQERVTSFEFLADEAERNIIKSRSAVFFGYADAHQAEFFHCLKNLRLVMGLFVPLFDKGLDFARTEFADSILQCFVFFGKFKIDHGFMAFLAK